ncbi:ABC transporter ATP-binding protein [Mesobacillus zeae]|uniref:ABC transporter ATP-binding protein n=1 Tax=Mesobacillus zeae TaxID=1917180 RepID=A0A398B2U3_9BACI|nr:ABC transporter ATP-binding protein [Mesobacillus zeae]RID82270.1 ABC transporter ATP-binding protein [Mesobacillus zeae]
MAIRVEGVIKRYGNKRALNGVSLTFEKGKIYGLLGQNGSGKSTLLKMIAGLVFPDEGTVSLSGSQVTRRTCGNVAYLTELDMFHDAFTVGDTIWYTASQFADFDQRKAQNLLKEFRLDPSKKVKSLSKGNRGRLKLVATLARNTEVILLDEPFSGLDPMVRDSIVQSLLKYIDFEQQVLIIATHEINEIEPLLDEAIVIRDGSVIGQEEVESLREEQGLSVLNWLKQLEGNKEEV